MLNMNKTTFKKSGSTEIPCAENQKSLFFFGSHRGKQGMVYTEQARVIKWRAHFGLGTKGFER